MKETKMKESRQVWGNGGTKKGKAGKGKGKEGRKATQVRTTKERK